MFLGDIFYQFFLSYMYTGTIPKSADWIVFIICSSAELTLQNQPILLPALLFYF